MTRLGLVLLTLAMLALSGCVHFGKCPAPAASDARPAHPLKWSPGNGQFFYAAGSSGTYTVPAGSYVTGVSCHATGGGATLTMTPNGPGVVSPVAGPSVPIPAGAALSLTRPLLQGNSQEFGTGSVFVFANTDAYILTLTQVGGP
jgi:hypothetical protein